MTVLRRIEGIPGTHSRHRGHTRSTASIGRMNRPLTILTATALGLSLSLVPVTPAVADGPSTTDVELVADPWPGAPPLGARALGHAQAAHDLDPRHVRRDRRPVRRSGDDHQ